MDGLLVIKKPRGMTSHDVVDRVRAISGTRRVGHAGTLDPLADGLLILLLGNATKHQRVFMGGEKEYLATIRLGAQSDTDDAEGRIRKTPNIRPSSEQHIRETLQKFIGDVVQVPPSYSAVKVRGRKAYELARQGVPPKLQPRRVHIKTLEVIGYAWPDLRCRVVCGPGTYIRALARDIGEALGCGGYLTALTRKRSGTLSLADAVALKNLTKENIETWLLPSP